MAASRHTPFPLSPYTLNFIVCNYVWVCSMFPPELAAATFSLSFCSCKGNKTQHTAAIPFSSSLFYMTPNNLMLQLSDSQASNPCFFFLSLSNRPVNFWPQIRVVSKGKRGERRKDRGKEVKWESKLGTSTVLKSLVALPLHWLPRDQQGAKSTQGRQKWRVF